MIQKLLITQSPEIKHQEVFYNQPNLFLDTSSR